MPLLDKACSLGTDRYTSEQARHTALDPHTVQVEDLSDLHAVAAAAEAALADEARLGQAARTARAHGRSWNQLATALGVSRQAARQRFSDKAPT